MKMKEIAMSSKEELETLTKELSKDTAKLAKESFEDEIDSESITSTVKAIFVGILEAVKKVY